MWSLSLPWWHFVLRAVVVYFFLLVALRLSGKRQVGQFSSFDLVLLLILSNAVQNSMNAGDNSITAGLILAGTLVALNYGVGALSYRFRPLDHLVQGRSEILIHHGVLREDVMKREQLTIDELQSALRASGCTRAVEVELAVLENNGHITVIQKRDWDQAKQEAQAKQSVLPPGAAEP